MPRAWSRWKFFLSRAHFIPIMSVLYSDAPDIDYQMIEDIFLNKNDKIRYFSIWNEYYFEILNKNEDRKKLKVLNYHMKKIASNWKSSQWKSTQWTKIKLPPPSLVLKILLNQFTSSMNVSIGSLNEKFRLKSLSYKLI
jgi:hypothetical protein